MEKRSDAGGENCENRGEKLRLEQKHHIHRHKKVHRKVIYRARRAELHVRAEACGENGSACGAVGAFERIF